MWRLFLPHSLGLATTKHFFMVLIFNVGSFDLPIVICLSTFKRNCQTCVISRNLQHAWEELDRICVGCLPNDFLVSVQINSPAP